MPEAPSSPRDILAETMADGRKVITPYLAEMLKTSRVAEVPTAEERKRFWQRAMNEQQEAELWVTEMQRRGLPPVPPADPVQADEYLKQMTDVGLGISKQVYVDRWDMMPQEGRDTQADQARWAWKHAKVGPPQAMQEGEQDVTQAPAVQQADQPGGAGPAAAEQVGRPVVPQGVGIAPGVQAPAAG